MEVINLISTIVLSTVAVGVSIFSFILSRRQLYNNSVTMQRIEWIKEVRALLSDFIKEYTENGNSSKLLSIKGHIELFININNPDHAELSNIMGNYVKNADLQIDGLINIAQVVFKNAWERMKWEAGFKKSQEKEIQKITYGKGTK